MEILFNVGSHLTVSEISGAAGASSRLWYAFAKSLFWSVKFKGTQNSLPIKLQLFLSYTGERMSQIRKSIRHASIVLADASQGTEHPGTADLLPALIASSILVMPHLSSLEFDVRGLTPEQEASFNRQLRKMPTVANMRSLQVSARKYTMLSCFGMCPSEKLETLTVGSSFGTARLLEFAFDHFPQLKRLSVNLDTSLHRYAHDACVLSPKIKRRITLSDFKQLEWLIIDERLDHYRPRPRPQVAILDAAARARLVQDIGIVLADMPNLCRLAFATARHDLNTARPEIRFNTVTVASKLICDLASILPNVHEICLLESSCDGKSTVIHRGTRSSMDGGMSVKVEDGCRRSEFPMGLLY
ncbi:hypothetical protein F66182_11136 [Fusarium sp. NRRL 66182]|nr:hypothetical protein F66182_11136 [Fusarium sp. NRRL 66182]